jgi:tetratricopeptide (TPR) repeat protein
MNLDRTLRLVVPGFLLLLVAFGAPASDETPSDYEQEVREGIRLHDAGDHAGAIAVYERVLKRRADDPWVLYEIAYSSMAAGRHKDAIDYAKRCIAASPRYAAESYAEQAGHLPALLHDVRRSLQDKEILAWLEEHEEDVERYRAWSESWQAPRQGGKQS